MMFKLLKNTQFVIFLGLILGFIIPQFGGSLKAYAIVALLIMNTLSMKDLSFPSLNENKKDVLWLVFVAFTIYPILMILLSEFVVSADYRSAMYVMAAMPPAIAVIPLAYLLKGNLKIALPAQFLAHIVTFVFTPAVIFLFLGRSISLYGIFKTLIQLIVVPFILSRILYKIKLKHDFKIEINLILAYTFYVAVAVSYESIIASWQSLFGLFSIIVLSSFLPLFIGLWVFRDEEISKKIIFVLFSMQKNTGMALGFVLLFLPPAASIVLSVNAVVGAIRNWVVFAIFKQ